jgi:hypothetical protein
MPSKYQNPSFDKELYKERRKRGMRGQIGYVNVNIYRQDDDGTGGLVPVGNRRVKTNPKRKR